MIVIRNQLLNYLTGEPHKLNFKGIVEKDGTFWFATQLNGVLKLIRPVDCSDSLTKGFSDTVKDFIRDANRTGKVCKLHPESFYLSHISETKGNIKKSLNSVKGRVRKEVIYL